MRRRPAHLAVLAVVVVTASVLSPVANAAAYPQAISSARAGRTLHLSWGIDSLISSTEKRNQPHVDDVSVNARGDVAVLWHTRPVGCPACDAQIFAASKPAATRWSSPQLLGQYDRRGDVRAAINVSGTGEVMAILNYDAKLGTVERLQYRLGEVGKRLGAARSVQSKFGSYEYGAVGFGFSASGKAVVAVTSLFPSPRLWTWERGRSGAFGAAHLLASKINNVAKVDIDAAGDVVAVWMTYADAGVSRLFRGGLTAAGRVIGPVKLDQVRHAGTPLLEDYDLDVATDGTAAIAWSKLLLGPYRREHRIAVHLGSQWKATRTLPHDDHGEYSGPSVAVSNSHVSVWWAAAETADDPHVLWSQEYTDDAWQTPIEQDSYQQPGFATEVDPDLAVSGEITLASWQVSGPEENFVQLDEPGVQFRDRILGDPRLDLYELSAAGPSAALAYLGETARGAPDVRVVVSTPP